MTKATPEELRVAIRRLHGCEATWKRTERVDERFRGAPVWSGDVELFSIEGSDVASECYAWGYPSGNGSKVEYVAILRAPPILSAVEAVRAFVASKARDPA